MLNNNNNYDIKELLYCIDPALLSYTEWLSCGMALKEAGYTASDWDEWSRSDSRYHKNECFRKWETFRGAPNPVTAGTIVQMAKDHGWNPPKKYSDRAFDWDDVIGNNEEYVILDESWIEGKDVSEPKNWNPERELIKYLETLFDSTENVGYVTQTWEKDGKYLPTQGHWDRTAGELIQELNKCNGDIGAVFGDYNEKAGAWIRFNPLDGNGIKNNNVTDFRYALVESDTVEIDKQNAIIRELELPVAALVHSGKKSLHAIVKINAADYTEYRKRVDYLYSVCAKNGLNVDTQNKNPSRLSRMPGIIRNGRKQFLIDANIGRESWDDWKEWIEGINDDLPDPENLETEWDNLPELSPPLIDNVLRQGHKMLLAGPSKAGKSFALIELCIAIAEGRKWLNWQCSKGRVLYVNLELDRASCLHRFKDVYTVLGWNAGNLKNIDIWNLRGKSIPMDKLAPKLIRRAIKKNYIAIVIDPIYKVITGDENSADQMAHFCNQFDKVCTELGCAVIYCHHHSKGGQSSKKSMDRASGSGVFARDPDALLDLIEIEELPESLITNEINNAACNVCIDILNQLYDDWEDEISQDAMCSQSQMMEYCKKKLSKEQCSRLNGLVKAAEARVRQMTAWKIEGTLREFPKFEPVNLWFDYPVHREDKAGVLKNIKPGYEKNFNKKNSPEERKKKKQESLDIAFQSNFGKEITVKELAEYMGVSEKTVRRYIGESDKYTIQKNVVKEKKPGTKI